MPDKKIREFKKVPNPWDKNPQILKDAISPGYKFPIPAIKISNLRDENS